MRPALKVDIEAENAFQLCDVRTRVMLDEIPHKLFTTNKFDSVPDRRCSMGLRDVRDITLCRIFQIIRVYPDLFGKLPFFMINLDLR